MVNWPRINVRKTVVSFLNCLYLCARMWYRIGPCKQTCYLDWRVSQLKFNAWWCPSVSHLASYSGGPCLESRFGDGMFWLRVFRVFTWSSEVHPGVLPCNGPWPVPFQTFASHLTYVGLSPYQYLIRCNWHTVSKPTPHSDPSTHIHPQFPVLDVIPQCYTGIKTVSVAIRQPGLLHIYPSCMCLT